MTYQNDATMKEKRDVLRNQASTLSQFAQAEAAEARGRFTAHEQSTVVGASLVPKYPAAYLQYDPVPAENPLGVDVNALEPCGEPHEIRASQDVSASLEPSSLPSPAQATSSPSSQVSSLGYEGLGSSRAYRRS